MKRRFPMPDGEVIRAWRAERGISQRKFAPMLGIDRTRLCRIEGQRLPLGDFLIPRAPPELQRRLIRGRIKVLRQMLREASHG